MITLTTDFGYIDSYAGVMKGVILGIAPTASIVDITHGIPAYDVMAGALTLDTALPYFPPNAVHVAVVDPGVGSERRAIAVETDKGVLLGPDNGLFTLILQKWSIRDIVAITNERYWLQPVSSTFHGRDIFAPVAAHIERGVPIRELGVHISNITQLDLPSPVIDIHDTILHIIYTDTYGNAITNLTGNSSD